MIKKTKVLLTKGHAVNNGDMALVLALYESLTNRGFDVSIATFHYKFLKTKYPNLPLVRELLDYNLLVGATFVKKIFLKLNYLFNKKYRGYDVYIGSPGGYMNSYYGLKKSLLPLIEAKKRGKKTAVYSQSIGPLNQRDKELLDLYSQSIDMILVRDDFSKACVDSTQCHSKILQTKDAAFLLKPRISSAKESKLVGVSVRSWKHDNRSMDQFNLLIQSFCEQVLENGFDLEFISTCQGVEGYVDDSIAASIIMENIIKNNPAYTKRIKVDSSYKTYFELVDILNSKYCFVIGTRLHMCILSLINGTLAFNISYEVKGKECYNYLNLQNYSVDFNEPIEQAMVKFGLFMSNYKLLEESIHDNILSVYKESHEYLDVFLSEMQMN